MTKKTTLSMFAAAAVLCAGTFATLSTTTASADEGFPKDCHLEGIDGAIESLKAQIKSSPANGHAGGHYAKALRDLDAMKAQLHEGCKVWNKDKGHH